MTDQNDDDRPIRQMARTVTLLHVVPGRADQPGNDEPISMLYLEHMGEVELLMLSMRDTVILC
jgi:hypothetical protein